MIKAPITANKIKPYIASAERRVNIHMNISKVRPRLVRGRTFDFVVAILASQRRLKNHESCYPKNRNKDCPFHPNGFLLMLERLRPKIHDRDTQSIDRME